MTAYELAMRYVGIRELAGQKDHPLIVWWLSLCNLPDSHDEVAWCSCFANGIAWELRLPRSKSAMARSWLNVGVPVALANAIVGNDVVVLSRGKPPSGHVGFFAGFEGPIDARRVLMLGGNQGDAVSITAFPEASVLGVRRLA